MTDEQQEAIERAIAALTEEQRKEKERMEELFRRSKELEQEMIEIRERIRKVRGEDQEEKG